MALRPRDVPLVVSGRARMRPGVLRRKLGDSAWYALLALWKHRAPNGETTITNAGLAHAKGFVAQSERVIRKAMTRLKAAALVEVVGWRKRSVPVGKGRGDRWVFVRRVFGANAEGGLGSDAILFVPGETARWSATAMTWGGKRTNAGGARKGAGRKESKPKEKKKGRPPLSQAGAVSPQNNQQEGRVNQQEGPTQNSARGAADLGSLISSVPEVSYPLASLGDAAPATSASTVSSIHLPERVSTPTEGDAPLAHLETEDPRDTTPDERKGGAAASLVQGATERGSGTMKTAVGFRLTEGGWTRPKAPSMPTSPLRGAPPLPWTLVGTATTPNPPLLDEEMGDDERAHALAAAFRGALASRFHEPGWALRRGPIQASKFFRTLVDSATDLLRFEIAPAAWAAWSCDVWKQYNSAARPPPVPWVFSTKRIAERRGWFAAEEESYMGGRIIMGAKKRELLERYMAMRLAIDAEGAWSDPAPVVARFFPGDAFDRAVVVANAEVKKDRERLRREADSGAFLW